MWLKNGIGVCTFEDRKSTRLNSSHLVISYAVFCLKKKMVMYTIPSSILISRGCSMAHLFKNFRILQTCRTARQRLVRAVEVSFCVFRRLTLSCEERGSLTGGGTPMLPFSIFI